MTGNSGGADASDGSRSRNGGATGAPTCPQCQAPLYKRHCKYVCPQHGTVYDCSDPFR